MAEKIDLGLGKAYDALFSSQEQRDDEKREKIIDIPLTELHTFKNHPFRVEVNDELREMARSILDHGVVTPAIARPRPEGGYELLSGHRRKAACQLAGLEILPTVVRELDDDAATIVMVDSNQQRENLLPSEKAFAYQMKYEAMKRQGKRTDLTSPQLAAKSRTDDALAFEAGMSGDTVRRYIRLTYLLPELLKMVDEGRIAMTPAVELSYLPKKLQEELLDTCEMLDCTPSLSQAVEMKKLAQAGKLKAEDVVTIMSRLKANQQDKLTFRKDTFAAYFPKGYTAKQMEESIINMLKERKRQLDRRRDEAR
ncbi:MAG: ParB/RepB/Spo0J family partition protein [Oscillospiraceae bacterium]|nr:ParB/RepB/Spo0J family partition protein [Oscillospiraceae bacterium]